MFYIYVGDELLYEPGNENLVVFTPKLTVEMGKAGSLEFSIASNNPFFTQLQQMKTVLTVRMDDTEIFRGRVLSNKRNFTNIRDIYVEGDLAYLVDSVQKAEKYTGKAHQLFRNIIAAHNKMVVDAGKKFTVGNITVEDRDVYLAGQSDDVTYEEAETVKFDYKQIAINSVAEEWQNTFDYIENCLIEYCGGYLRTRNVNGTNYIDWLKDYYNDGTQSITVGKNVLDLTEEVSIEDAFTVLIPIGDENLTIETAAAFNTDGIQHTKNSAELVDTAAVEKYGRIIKTNVFDSVTTVDTLLENGKRYLKNNVNIPVTVTVTAVDMHLIEPDVRAIFLGDRMKVESDYHEIDDYYTCTKIEYDLGNPANTVYTFGQPKQTLTERYRKDKKSNADAARRGGGGGGGASKAADEEGKKDLDEFFDAWINCDPSRGNISLGALYEKFEHGKTVLKNTAGINIDAPSGTLNIYADHHKNEETQRLTNNIVTVLDNTLGIDLNADAGTIEIYAKQNKVTDDHTELRDIHSYLTTNLGLTLDLEGRQVNLFNEIDDSKTTTTKVGQVDEFIKSQLGVTLDNKGYKLIVGGTFDKTVKDTAGITKYLKNEIGLNIDTGKATFSLKGDHTSITEVSNGVKNLITTLNRSAGLDVDVSNAFAKLYATVNDKTESVRGDLDSVVKEIKKEVGVTLDGQSGTVNIHSIATDVDNNKDYVAEICTWAGYDEETKKWSSKVGVNADLINLHSEVNGHIAEIKTWAGYDPKTGKYGSNIALAADIVDIKASQLFKVEAKLLDVAALSGVVSLSKGYISVPGIYTSHVLLDNWSIKLHTHEVDVKTDGTVKVGEMTFDTSKASFKIADTQFYKDGVSAARESTRIYYQPAGMDTFCDAEYVQGYGYRYRLRSEVYNANGQLIYRSASGYAFSNFAVYNRGRDDGYSLGVADVNVVGVRRSGNGVYITLSNGKTDYYDI